VVRGKFRPFFFLDNFHTDALDISFTFHVRLRILKLETPAESAAAGAVHVIKIS
jgi:hypothetical protein